MTHEFKHPKYYTELRKRNKSDQAISPGSKDSVLPRRAPDSGLKLPGPRPISNANKGLIHKQQASIKLVNACIDQEEPQAPSTKQQASGFKQK